VDYLDYKTGAQPDHSVQDFDIEEFLEQSQRQEKQRLEEELDRIKDQLKSRDEIHEETLDELESKLDWYLDRLETLYKRGGGTPRDRDQLKSRITEFYRDIREERQQHWRDRQQLEKERRELQRSLEEINSNNLQQLF